MFQAIAKFFQNLFKSPAVQKFEQWCVEVFNAEKPLILGALKDIAIQAVATAQTTGLDNATKRAQAFGQVEAYAKAKGIEVGDSIINLAIEMAVSALKKD